MASPLIDTLFRPTTPAPEAVETPARPSAAPTSSAASSVASAAPVRVTGTRTRAGNAMNRSRSALLAGAATAVASTGTKITMAQVATVAGLAKATLYNHFRTREAVLEALLRDQVHAIIAAHREQPLTEALTGAAGALAAHPVLRGLAHAEPATLANLARIDSDAPAWAEARVAVEAVLVAAGRGGTDTVLRWLASFIVSPADHDQIGTDAAILVAGLPRRILPPGSRLI